LPPRNKRKTARIPGNIIDIGRVEHVHADPEYVNEKGDIEFAGIDWLKAFLLDKRFKMFLKTTGKGELIRNQSPPSFANNALF
jgi:hypothetical protein